MPWPRLWETLLIILTDAMVYQKEVVLMPISNFDTIINFFSLVTLWLMETKIFPLLIRRVSPSNLK
jgi:hypothetical protein